MPLGKADFFAQVVYNLAYWGDNCWVPHTVRTLRKSPSSDEKFYRIGLPSCQGNAPQRIPEERLVMDGRMESDFRSYSSPSLVTNREFATGLLYIEFTVCRIQEHILIESVVMRNLYVHADSYIDLNQLYMTGSVRVPHGRKSLTLRW